MSFQDKMSLFDFFTYLGFKESTANTAAKHCTDNDIISVEHLLSCSEQDLEQMKLSVGIKRKVLSHSQSSLSWNQFLSQHEESFDPKIITQIQSEMKTSIPPLDTQINKAQKQLTKLQQKKNYLTNSISSIQEFLSIVENIKRNPFQVPLISHDTSKTTLTKQEESNVKTVIKFYLIISSQNREKELVLQCGKALLENIIVPSRLTSELFLQLCTRKFLRQSLLKCNDKDLRCCFRDVLWAAMKNVVPKTGSFHCDDETSVDSVCISYPTSTDFLFFQDSFQLFFISSSFRFSFPIF